MTLEEWKKFYAIDIKKLCPSGKCLAASGKSEIRVGWYIAETDILALKKLAKANGWPLWDGAQK